MSFLDKALTLAEQGFYVFPLRAGSKLPAIDDFPNRATRDPEQIKKFWIDPVLELEQPYNIGISTTRFNGSQALVVVDVDNKGKKKGSEEVLKLELEGFDFVETATAITPSGGKHFIYRAKIAVKQGTDVLALGLDIRSNGGYVVAWGSVIDGAAYEWEDGNLAVAECPNWIIEKCGTPLEKDERVFDVAKVNVINTNSRAVEYLKTALPAEEGMSGDKQTYKVAAKLKDFGVSATDAVALMLDHWNDKCSPPWSPEDLTVKINNAFEYGVHPPGVASPEADFKPIGEIVEKNFLKEMNEKYAVVFSEDSHTVLFETVDEKGRPKREFLKESAFKRKFSPHTVQQGKGAAKSFAEIWLDWKGRREYSGLCFRPEQTPGNNYYNLWRGFTYKTTAFSDASAAARLGFEMFIEHAKENVCGKDEKLFTWLMGYFAHMIQRPYERPLTTLVFRGRKGVGKNALVDRIGKLLGSGHYLVAHDGRYLTSNFNGHLDSCLCLVLDEAFWSGDKQAEGKLKGITTAPEIMIERKGKEPYMVDNLVRLIVIGNEDWLVPASYDERRYAVLDVGEGRKQQGSFFEEMRILMDQKGGAEILMHYLKNFDLKTVDVNSAPNTRGLEDQKMASLSSFEQFWLQCLTHGQIINSDFNESWEEGLQVDKEVFRRAYAAFCKDRTIKVWGSHEVTIGREIKKVTPSVDTGQKSKDHKRVYRFGSITQCREEWCKRIGIEKDWD